MDAPNVRVRNHRTDEVATVENENIDPAATVAVDPGGSPGYTEENFPFSGTFTITTPGVDPAVFDVKEDSLKKVAVYSDRIEVADL